MRSALFLLLLIGFAGTTAPAEASPGGPVQLSSVLSGEVRASGWSWRYVGAGRDSCPTYYVCIWTGTNFTGSGVGFTGNIAYGEGIFWLDTIWENNVHSAVNKATIRVEFLDYLGDGQSRRLGKLYPGYDFKSGWPGANYADGLMYL